MPSSDIILAVHSRWALGKKLGAGGFAKVYQATDMKTGEIVAIKLEKASNPHPRLAHEHKVYQHIHSHSKPAVGFPKVYFHTSASRFNVLVMDCLGSSLEQLVCKKRLPLKTTLHYGIQALGHLKHLHETGYIHCDVKPENIMLGRCDSSKVYVADLGLARRYREESSGRHVGMKGGNVFVGTPSFASRNAHGGVELSRRDDLESLGYVLVYLFRGELPWNRSVDGSCAPWRAGEGGGGLGRNEEIGRMKEDVAVCELCEGMGAGVMEYLSCVRKLGFDEKPDYAYLQALLHRELRNATRIRLRK